MFMDEIQLYAKNENGLDALVQSVRVVSSDTWNSETKVRHVSNQVRKSN